MGGTPKPTRRHLIVYLADQGRPHDDRKGTKAPLEWVIVQLAERWGLHPADVDPRGQRPARAAWFWWALEMYNLAAQDWSGTKRG